MLLKKTKELLAPIIPRQGRFFRFLRKLYKNLDHQLLRFETRNQAALSRLARKQKNIRSIRKTPEGIIVQFENGHSFIWSDPTNSDDLLTMIVAGRVSFEAEESRLLMSLIDPEQVVLDIGANIGWHSVEFCSAVGAKGKVHAFEPLPENYQLLTRNLALNYPQKAWEAYNYALGSSSGKAKLYVPTHLGLSFSSLIKDYNQDMTSAREVEVSIETLDSFMNKNQITRIDFIKCDVEGAQLDTFRGGEKLLEKFQPLIYCEINNRDSREIFTFMEKYGYQAYHHNNKYRFKEVFDYNAKKLPDFNFLFVTPKHKTRLTEKGYAFKK